MRASAVLSCGWCGHRAGIVSELNTSKTIDGKCDNCNGTGKWELELKEEGKVVDL